METLVPYSGEAEEALIGALLINPNCYYEICQLLKADDFYIHRHRFIWEAIVDLNDCSSPVDILTLTHELDCQGRLAEIGGPAYLTALINNVPTSLHAAAYAQIIAENAVRRRLLEAANQAARAAYQADIPLDQVIDLAEKSMLSAGERTVSRSIKPLVDVASRLYDQVTIASKDGQEMLGLPTGFIDLDKILKGLRSSNLIIVAGRPGMGKTSFLLSLAKTQADQWKKHVALFSLEMSDEEIAQRILSQQTGIDGQRLASGQLKEHEWPEFVRSLDWANGVPLLIDDTPSLTVTQLRSRCRRLAAEGSLDLVMVDYLQLMTGGGRFENRQAEVAYISRQLKGLAKDLEVPIVAAAQLSRAVEGRGDKRPVLSDLRESGSIEMDADVVIFLYRQENMANLVDVEVAKHRNGPTGTIQLVYRPAITKFENAAQPNL